MYTLTFEVRKVYPTLVPGVSQFFSSQRSEPIEIGWRPTTRVPPTLSTMLRNLPNQIRTSFPSPSLSKVTGVPARYFSQPPAPKPAEVHAAAEGDLAGLISIADSNATPGDIFLSDCKKWAAVNLHQWADLSWCVAFPADYVMKDSITRGISWDAVTDTLPKAGDVFTRCIDPERNAFFRVPSGLHLQGQILDAVGNPLGRTEPLENAFQESTTFRYHMPSIEERAPIHEPLFTGITAIDSLVPIGKGQAMLMYGPSDTGKTNMALDFIIGQKDRGVHCYYVTLGRAVSDAIAAEKVLLKHGAMDYTTILSGSSNDLRYPAPGAMRFLAPFVACAMAEYERNRGRDALVIYDDLSKHALDYDKLCFVLDESGRSLPRHVRLRSLYSNLIQRSARMAPDMANGSLTTLGLLRTSRDYEELPFELTEKERELLAEKAAEESSAAVSETQDTSSVEDTSLGGNSSNVLMPPFEFMSVSDGQIALSQRLARKNVWPALDIPQSVSRIGNRARTPLLNTICMSMRTDIVQMMQEAQDQEGSPMEVEMLLAALQQPAQSPYPVEHQFVRLLVATHYLPLMHRLGQAHPRKLPELLDDFLAYLATVQETPQGLPARVVPPPKLLEAMRKLNLLPKGARSIRRLHQHSAAKRLLDSGILEGMRIAFTQFLLPRIEAENEVSSEKQ